MCVLFVFAVFFLFVVRVSALIIANCIYEFLRWPEHGWASRELGPAVCPCYTYMHIVFYCQFYVLVYSGSGRIKVLACLLSDTV